MTGKRFEIIDKEFISYYGGDGHLISNGECKFWLWHSKEESQKVCDKLNSILDENKQLKQRINVLDDQITAQRIVIESYQNRNQKLFDEKEHIKQTIRDMMEYERTELGRSVLKQLWEAIQ